jgi:hypothetical protein
MQVVVENRESADSNREDFRELFVPFFDPIPAVRRPVREEKRTADAAIDAVVPASDG